MSMDVTHKRILCVGLCVLDVIHECNQFPVEDSDIRSMHGRWQRGGNASNICTVLTQLGDICEFLGSLPNTKMFQFVIDDAVDRGIQMSNCALHDNYQAPMASVILNDATGSRTIVFSSANLPILTFEDFRKLNFSEYGWIHFEARNREETVQMIDSIVQWNAVESNHKITISLELEKPVQENLCLTKNADIIFVGKDFCHPFGWTKETAVNKIALSSKKTAKIICAWGEEGATALDVATHSYYTAAACPPEKIIDTLGAGDTFVAAAIHTIYRCGDLPKSIEFGCRVAGAKIGFHGYDQIGEIFNNAKFIN